MRKIKLKHKGIVHIFPSGTEGIGKDNTALLFLAQGVLLSLECAKENDTVLFDFDNRNVTNENMEDMCFKEFFKRIQPSSFT